VELSMKVEFRKLRDISETIHGERIVEMLIYMVQYAVKASRIDVLFRSAVMFHWRLIPNTVNLDSSRNRLSSLRAERSNPGVAGGPWIAASASPPRNDGKDAPSLPQAGEGTRSKGRGAAPLTLANGAKPSQIRREDGLFSV
jgi:hypothetical protein